MRSLYTSYAACFVSSSSVYANRDYSGLLGSPRFGYWAEGVPRESVQRWIDNASFGVFDGDLQVGFARVITDRATYAYIGDVFILESHRGRGLSKRLMKAIMEHADLQGLRCWSLVTTDAHGRYRQFGFTPLADPQRYIELVNPDVYKERR